MNRKQQYLTAFSLVLAQNQTFSYKISVCITYPKYSYIFSSACQIEYIIISVTIVGFSFIQSSWILYSVYCLLLWSFFMKKSLLLGAFFSVFYTVYVAPNGFCCIICCRLTRNTMMKWSSQNNWILFYCFYYYNIKKYNENNRYFVYYLAKNRKENN